MGWPRPIANFNRRRTVQAVRNRLSRAARVGNYWYWLHAPELAGADIAALISPLRYDVLVRAEFYSFYVAHRSLYRADFQAFVERVRHSSYYIWFTQSEAIRCRLDTRGHPQALERAFVARLRSAVDLYEKVTSLGFSQKFPIVLKTAERLLPPTADKLAPPTGKFVSAQYFMADGCHRLALLMALGYRTLPAGYFRVKCFKEFSPFDSTSLLAQTLPISPPDYFTFLSSKYCAPLVFRQRDSFLEHVRQNRPEALAEVLSVIRVDGFDAEASSDFVRPAAPVEMADV
jgi:hypothetical protein